MALEFPHSGLTRVALAGELDVAQVERLRGVLYGALKQSQMLVLDLGELTFVDLPGTRLLIEMTALAAAEGCRIELSRPRASVERIFELTSARALLPIHKLGH